MKKLFYNVLAIIIYSLTFGIAPLAAQELYATEPQGEKECQVGLFEGLHVSGHLDVTLQEGRCAVTLNGDKALIPYIIAEVRDSILYIGLDEKAIPADVKKIYRGRNTPVPILRATVTVPALNSITGTQNAIIRGSGVVFADNLDLTLTDKASIQDLELDAAYAKLHMNKNSLADFGLTSESQLELSLDGNSQLKLACKAHNLLLYQAGSSTAILTGESATSTFDIMGNAKNRTNLQGSVLVLYAGGLTDVSLAGQMGDLTLSAERSAKIEGLEMNAQRVMATMSGWTKATVQAEEFLSVDLTGGSTLYYSGVPAIQIEKVVKSTLAPNLINEKQ